MQSCPNLSRELSTTMGQWEVLSSVWASEQWHMYLYGCYFTLQTIRPSLPWWPWLARGISRFASIGGLKGSRRTTSPQSLCRAGRTLLQTHFAEVLLVLCWTPAKTRQSWSRSSCYTRVNSVVGMASLSMGTVHSGPHCSKGTHPGHGAQGPPWRAEGQQCCWIAA